MEETIRELAELSLWHEINQLLVSNPELNVSGSDIAEWTILHMACLHGSETTVSLLLSHPGVNINGKTRGGSTAFSIACTGGHITCMRVILGDERFACDSDTTHAICMNVVHDGLVEVIEEWIASGKYAGSILLSDECWFLKHQRGKETLALLRQFATNAGGTRKAMRLKTGWYDRQAAMRFSVIVFVCDRLLEIKKNANETDPTVRFLRMVGRLPLDLQMMTCHRLVNSQRDIILSNHVEDALRAEDKEWN